MKKLTYLAILEPTADGYSVFFPDLPGCIGYGTDIESAQNDAKESLELHVYGMEKSGEILPPPSASLNEEDTQGCIVSAVTIFPELVRNEMDSRRVKTNVTIPSWLKEIAEANQVNYSRLLEVSLMEYLNIQPRISK